MATLNAALKRLEGVDKVAISMPRQMFAVFYKPDASFDPKDLRAAADKAHVRVIRLHISAQGKVQQEEAAQIFVSGNNRFRIADSPQLPTDQLLGVMATVDDSSEEVQIQIDDYKSLGP